VAVLRPRAVPAKSPLERIGSVGPAALRGGGHRKPARRQAMAKPWSSIYGTSTVVLIYADSTAAVVCHWAARRPLAGLSCLSRIGHWQPAAARIPGGTGPEALRKAGPDPARDCRDNGFKTDLGGCRGWVKRLRSDSESGRPGPGLVRPQRPVTRDTGPGPGGPGPLPGSRARTKPGAPGPGPRRRCQPECLL
jgi:hypothetical protein